MKATVSFKIPEFNSMGTKEINFKEQEDKETTFRSIWKSFNKTLDKNWQSIEFDFNNETILVCKHWLIETDFNFEQSHQIQ
jgi:hypothetical protein